MGWPFLNNLYNFCSTLSEVDLLTVASLSGRICYWKPRLNWGNGAVYRKKEQKSVAVKGTELCKEVFGNQIFDFWPVQNCYRLSVLFGTTGSILLSEGAQGRNLLFSLSLITSRQNTIISNFWISFCSNQTGSHFKGILINIYEVL